MAKVFEKCEDLRWFQREYELAERADKLDVGVKLDHMAKIYVQGCPRIAIIMEKAHCDLERYVHVQRKKKHYNLYNILRQITEKIKKLHRDQIFHRDLKPANILVMKDGIICIADFGVATKSKTFRTEKRWDDRPIYSTFPAPEQHHERTVCWSAAADMWALGVTAVFLMFQIYPFEVNNPHEGKAFVDNLETTLSTEFKIYTPMLRGLLNANPEKRWTSEDVLQFLDLIGI